MSVDLLSRAFAVVSEEYGWPVAKLHVEVVEPRCRCQDCGSEFAPENFTLRCLHCGGARVTLDRGREMEVESVEAV